MIRLYRNGVLSVEVEHTPELEKYFKDKEDQLLLDKVSFKIVGSHVELSRNSIIGKVEVVGKPKKQKGDMVRWVKITVLETTHLSFTQGDGYWIRFKVDDVLELVRNPFHLNGKKLYFKNIQKPRGDGGWVHGFGDVSEHITD